MFVTVKIYSVTWVVKPFSEKCISALRIEGGGSSTMLRTYQITQCDKSEDHCLNIVDCARLSILTLCVFFVTCHLLEFSVVTCHLLQFFVVTCHLLQFFVVTCHLLQFFVVTCHLLQFLVVTCHLLQFFVVTCHLLQFLLLRVIC